jgi:hypothetical protein
MFPLIGWLILASFVYIAALIMCVLPVLYVAAALWVLPVVVAVERTGAIGRSFSLFHGAIGPALGRILTIAALYIAVGLVFSVITAVATAALGAIPAGATTTTPTLLLPLGAEVMVSVLQTVAMGALAVLTAPLTVLTYADLRARKEYTTAEMIRADVATA